MKRLLTAQVAALALLLLGGAGVQATPLPPDQVQWTYNFTPVAPGTYSSLAAVMSDDNPSGAGVTLTNEDTKFATGSSDVVATNLRVFSSASATTPNILSTNGDYGLTLNLSVTDDDGVHSGTLNFTGKLSGKFSAESSAVANVFGPNSTQTLTLGEYLFTVSLIAYTPPGPPNQFNAGSIAAHVEVSSKPNPTPSEVTPEPSAILLSGLGLSFLGGAAWRRRRAQARA